MTQIVFETQRSIGELDGTVKLLIKGADKHDEKLEKILESMNTAKGSLDAFRTMAKWMGSIVLALLTAIFAALVKHFHWI